jgi:hypothetical protein
MLSNTHLYERRGPITSVEWSPFEASTLVASAGDQQISLWDLSVERDPEEEAALALPSNAAVPDQVPPQLLFQHCGQTDMKEVAVAPADSGAPAQHRVGRLQRVHARERQAGQSPAHAVLTW